MISMRILVPCSGATNQAALYAVGRPPRYPIEANAPMARPSRSGLVRGSLGRRARRQRAGDDRVGGGTRRARSRGSDDGIGRPRPGRGGADRSRRVREAAMPRRTDRRRRPPALLRQGQGRLDRRYLPRRRLSTASLKRRKTVVVLSSACIIRPRCENDAIAAEQEPPLASFSFVLRRL